MRAIHSSREADPRLYFTEHPVLELIDGMGLGGMVESAEKFGPRFWGLDLKGSLYDTTADIPNRLIQFKKVLCRAPNIDKSTFNSTGRSSDEIIKEAEKTKKLRITLQRAKHGGAIERELVSVTLEESLRNPEVLIEVTKKMQSEHDPVANAISALEDWRLSEAKNAPTTQYLKLGIATYEVALLGMRRERVHELVGEAALSRHVAT